MNKSLKSMRSGIAGEKVSTWLVWVEEYKSYLTEQPNILESIMSYIAWCKAVQRLISCPIDWWYAQYRSSQNYVGIGSESGLKCLKNSAWGCA